MAIELRTPRGTYELTSVGEPERLADAFVLTLSLARRDGIETVAFRCRIENGLLGASRAAGAELVQRLAPWIEREFEPTREAALKSVRSERKLLEIAFDRFNRGPF